MDGEAHRWRKQMFMSLMSPANIQQLVDVVVDQWRAHVGTWEGMDQRVLLDEVQNILCRPVCEWADVPLSELEAEERTREFAAMVDGAGSVGPRNSRGLLLRARTEHWIRGIVEKVRKRELEIAEESAAHAIAWHRDLDRELLDKEAAAVELIDALRPTVAVAWFVTFAALALHEHPESQQKLQDGDDDYLELFVQEVRRFYPFFPLAGGRVRTEFDWRGRHFARGAWVLLDLTAPTTMPGCGGTQKCSA